MFWLQTLLKYVIVGCIGTAVDVGFLYIFVEFLHLPLFVAVPVSFILAVVNNFLLNKIWTFRNNSANYKKLFIKFLLVSYMGLLLTSVSMFVLVTAGIWYVYAKLLTSLLVLTWNFLANKYWTFVNKQKPVLNPESFAYKLSVIVPAFNEEKRIDNTLDAIDRYLQEKVLSYEIIVVDDGSIDATSAVVQVKAERIKGLQLICLAKNGGKGLAIKRAVEAAQGQYILATDADNSTPIEEFDALFSALGTTYDLAIGSRYLHGSKVQIRQPVYRILIGRIGNLLIRTFIVDGIADTQCGFKLFTATAAKEIFCRQKIHRWGYDMEALAIAKILQYKTIEVPVSWMDSSQSRLRPIRDTFRTLIELIYIKLNLLGGRYSD